MGQKNKQFIQMTEKPIHRLIASLAVPNIISMLATAIYSIADTYFVSQLGTSASAAVGIVFSLMAIIQAVGFTIGMGAGTRISRLLGKEKNDLAKKVASSSVAIGLLMGVILAVIGIVFNKQFMHLLGATETILPYAVIYAHYIFLATPAMILSFILSNLLRSEGRATASMFGILVGCIVNVILIPILMFVFHMGIEGPAISTAISQYIGLLILSIPFFTKRTVLCLSIKKVALSIRIYWDILKDGTPSLFRQGSASVAAVLLNLNAARYGDAAVAAMSIVTKIFMVIFSIMIGYGQGYQPVVGYNYGAKKNQRVKEAFWFTLKTGTIGMTFFGVLVWFLAPALMRAFLSHDKNVLEIGTSALRMQCFATPFMALGVISNMTLQAVERNVSATILTAARQGIFFLPLILTLPQFLGLTGIEMAQPIADVATFLLCIPFLYVFFHKSPKAVVARKQPLPEPKAGKMRNKKIR